MARGPILLAPMPHRSPARWLAPLSLLATLVAVLAILTAGQGGDASTVTPDRAVDAGSPGQRTSTGSSSRRPSRERSTYTVRSGDVLSEIAAQTGVSMERLQELNPDLDAQSLRVGQRLRLRE